VGSTGDNPNLPGAPDELDRPRVGVDEWVAQVEERRDRYTGLSGLTRRIFSGVPVSARLGVFVVFAASLPLWMGRGDLFSYGIFTLLYALLGLGLNVVVGYAGLLDLGYIAFFGFGAYFYAELSSEQYGIHWWLPPPFLSSSLPQPFWALSSASRLAAYSATTSRS
jgi:ABC-type branched-subunit amino acid transport system permease subunit